MALTTTTLLNGLKSLFGASSSAPASNSRIPYCNSSNEVAGSTSLTDLALVLGARQYKQEFASGSNTSAKCRITMDISNLPSVLDIIVEDNWPHNSRRYVFSTRNSSGSCELVYGTEATGQSHTLNGLVLDITMGSYSYVYVRKTIGSNTYTVTDAS